MQHSQIISNTQHSKLEMSQFLKCTVLCFLSWLIISLLEDSIKDIVTFIFINQTLLMSWLIHQSPSSDMKIFLSIIQTSKLDFKFLDKIFWSRQLMSKLFYDIQSIPLNNINFVSGSTFANFWNLFYMLFLLWIVMLTFKLSKNWVRDSKINIITLYIQKYLNPNSFVVFVKLSMPFIFVNIISEVINQFKLSSDESDFKSYILSYTLLIIYFLIVFISSKYLWL